MLFYNFCSHTKNIKNIPKEWKFRIICDPWKDKKNAHVLVLFEMMERPIRKNKIEPHGNE